MGKPSERDCKQKANILRTAEVWFLLRKATTLDRVGSGRSANATLPTRHREHAIPITVFVVGRQSVVLDLTSIQRVPPKDSIVCARDSIQTQSPRQLGALAM